MKKDKIMINRFLTIIILFYITFATQAQYLELDPAGDSEHSNLHRFLSADQMPKSYVNAGNTPSRYYDSEIGRFLTQDAYLGEVNTPPSLHRYLYAYGNPTVYVDPTGFATITQIEAERKYSVTPYL